MITAYLSIEEANELFDTLEVAFADEPLNDEQVVILNEFLNNLGFRIEAYDK